MIYADKIVFSKKLTSKHAGVRFPFLLVVRVSKNSHFRAVHLISCLPINDYVRGRFEILKSQTSTGTGQTIGRMRI